MPAPGKRRRKPSPDELIEIVRSEFVADPRRGVFDVQLDILDETPAIVGQTTHPEAVTSLIERLAATGVTAADNVIRLPDPGFGDEGQALVRAAVAPLYAQPKLPAPQISQLVLGMRVELLSRFGDWLRVRGEDGYVGWVHRGYMQPGSRDWATGWERGSTGEPVVSLGADLADEDGRILARLPWGARLVRHTGAYLLPDGVGGSIVNGEVVDVDRLADRFPPRGDSIARTARRWLGAPYIWGGVTPWGVDCSGFTQAVMWMHGIALPRDSDLQADASVGVEVSTDYGALRIGDLLYFADPGERISHVGIGLGGSLMIHSSLGNGGVHVNDLAGDQPFDRRLASIFVRARRVLSD
jgi:gamma-D-glutamyl-L-lysine dipeptidyl-peptidase